MITGGDLRQSRLDVGYKTFTISPCHGIWSLQLTLKKLDIDILNRTFSGEVAFKAQDHFGLNIDDVNGGKYFEFLRIFRSWFLLQRYDKFGYKPFITEMNHIRKISGIF